MPLTILAMMLGAGEASMLLIAVIEEGAYGGRLVGRARQ
jgi:hypothetical protein